MYSPTQFRIEDPATTAAIIRKNSFGTLVTASSAGLVATHLPFLFSEPSEQRPSGTLRAHMARANAQWKDFEKGGEVLVIFQGEHGYISPAWYRNTVAPHVPTWNYEAVHAYGVPRLIAEEAAVMELLHASVQAYEPAGSSYVSRALPEEYLANTAKSIVAFEIEITRLEAKVKMSQNRDVSDVRRILENLEATGDASSLSLAKAIRSANRSRLDAAG